MAKNSVRDFDATAANNTDIQSVDIAENCAPSGINNAIRELMADIKDVSAGTIALESPQTDSLTVTGDLTVDTNTLYVDSTNNNVGIGEVSPDSALHVNSGTANTAVTIESTDAACWQVMRDPTADIFFGNTGGNFALYTGGSERMRIDSSGNVGIGTGSPTISLASGNKVLHLDSGTNQGSEVRLEGASGNFTVGNNALGAYLYNFSNTPTIFTTNSTERMRIDSSGNVGIGVTDPASYYAENLVVKAPAEGGITIRSNATTDTNYLMFADGTSGTQAYRGYLAYTHNSPEHFNIVSHGYMRFYTGDPAQERMRIDSSGNLLVGTTDVSQFNNSGASADTGVVVAGTSYIDVSRVDNPMLYLNRCNTDGQIVSFSKDGTQVGSIVAQGGARIAIGNGDTGLIFVGSTDAIHAWDITNNASRDNAIDLGNSSNRFDDIFATNGTIQTSDQNEKQQIASLTDTEITAAKAISKLFKTFKWNDSVSENGDNARTHAGVIAQDVQQAMTDEGLDAADYAFWCSNTWWETQTEVPAVEAVEAQDAVLDDDGNIVTEAVEAVEAKDAYTRTDTYDTADEAPEGATERTRLGIRYPELLAFVCAATEQRLADIETRLTALEA